MPDFHRAVLLEIRRRSVDDRQVVLLVADDRVSLDELSSVLKQGFRDDFPGDTGRKTQICHGREVSAHSAEVEVAEELTDVCARQLVYVEPAVLLQSILDQVLVCGRAQLDPFAAPGRDALSTLSLPM